MQFRPEAEFAGIKNKNSTDTGIFWKLEIFYESQTMVRGVKASKGDEPWRNTMIVLFRQYVFGLLIAVMIDRAFSKKPKNAKKITFYWFVLKFFKTRLWRGGRRGLYPNRSCEGWCNQLLGGNILISAWDRHPCVIIIFYYDWIESNLFLIEYHFEITKIVIKVKICF